ncbi:ankyrin repeat domain-containing protein [bacterium]|nr:ankyrin repeat domain-containing protein [bacterium]
MDADFLILVSAVVAAFFGISLYMMNRVMKGLGDFYLKQKQEFMEKVKDPETLMKHDDRGFTPLMVALEKKWTNLLPEVLQRVLQLNNPLAVINHSNSMGLSAIILAIDLGEKDSLELLIAAGADVNKIHEPDETLPLAYACNLLKVELVEVLLLRGARVEIKNREGLTVLEVFSARFKKQISKREGVEYKVYQMLDENKEGENE